MRILVRLALWPVRMALTLLEWIILFVTHFMGIGCYLLSGGCCVLAVAGWLTGLSPVKEVVQTLVIGFIFFIVPLVDCQVVCAIRKINLIFNHI